MDLFRRATAVVITALAVLAGLAAPSSSSTAAAAAASSAVGSSVGPPGPSRPVALAAGLPTVLNLTATPSRLVRGAASTLTGRLTDLATGSGLTGAPVHLEVMAPDGSWVGAALLTTDPGGAVSSVQTPMTSTVFRLRHGEPGAVEMSTSSPVTLTVQTITAALGRESVRLGKEVSVRGSLAPGTGSSTVRLERRVDGRWTRAGRTAADADGSFSFVVTPDAPGFWRWRVLRGAGPAAEVRTLPRLDAFRLHRYSVRTRGNIRAPMPVFRRSVAATYADPRGWLRSHHRFRAVQRSSGRLGEFTVVLAQAQYLPTYSSVCSTTYSCRVGRFVIINQDRWRRGSPYFPGTLEQYRRMVVNHETGHWLGRGHAYCSGPRALAPVMQQQSKGLHGCRVNPWPLPREVRAAAAS